ncbi:unnamed protein product [Nippostrongylus brasiliensis]|uniref:Transposase n=1 Tax=Nippostrongylus brasiliensis TaxID=27835 RepID=A0A0N4Y039_NIPBR|nr:unnamed protein product [Nippostrongylus brasiliensis]
MGEHLLQDRCLSVCVCMAQTDTNEGRTLAHTAEQPERPRNLTNERLTTIFGLRPADDPPDRPPTDS